MWTWTLISHITGKGIWLLLNWQIKHSIYQCWESKDQEFSLDYPFLTPNPQFFPPTQHGAVFQTLNCCSEMETSPPLWSVVLLTWQRLKFTGFRRKQEKWCLNTKPLLPPIPSCALKAILAEPPGHSYHACGLSKDRQWWENGKAVPSHSSPCPWVILSWWRHEWSCKAGAGGWLGCLKTSPVGKATCLHQGSVAAGHMRDLGPG